jgi:hypothetical protein
MLCIIAISVSAVRRYTLVSTLVPLRRNIRSLNYFRRSNLASRQNNISQSHVSDSDFSSNLVFCVGGYYYNCFYIVFYEF